METGNKLSIATHSSTKEFFDLTFSNEPASYYFLVLEADELWLRACWYHQSKNLITGYAEYPLKTGHLKDALESLLKDHPFLNSEFHQTIVSVRTSNYVLVPRSMEGTDHEALFTTTNTFDRDKEVLLTYPLVNLRAHVLFGLEQETQHALKSAFFHASIVPHVAPRIEDAYNRMKSGSLKNLVLTHVSADHVDVIAFMDQKLVLTNSFFQHGKEDIAYYVLYSAEVLGIHPEEVTLSVSGQIAIGDEVWQMLSSYWKKIELANALEHVTVSTKLEHYPKAKFDYLTQSLLCAS